MTVPAALSRRLGQFSARQIFLLVFILAFAVRVVGVVLSHQYRDQERFELERVALSVAHTGVFGNPYFLPTGPTAHVSPGYPLILAAIFRLFGTGTTGELAKQFFASASSALVCAAVPFAARALSIPAVAGLGAALFTALLPVKLRTETEGDWESPYAALGLLLVVSLTVIAWRDRRFDTRFAILTGFVWGITLLFVSAFLPLLPALLVVGLLLIGREQRAGYLRYAAAVCLCAFVCLAPWAWRNWKVLGEPIFGRDNTGIELRVSNNPYAGPSEKDNFFNGVYDRYHPLQSRAEAVKVRDMGEIAFNRMALGDARRWMSENPGRFLRLTVSRIRWYWFLGDRRTIPRAVFFAAYTLLAFAGLPVLYRRNRLAFAAVLTVLVVVPLPNYLVHLNTKHRYPIDWLLVLLAALAVWEWWHRRQAAHGIYITRSSS